MGKRREKPRSQRHRQNKFSQFETIPDSVSIEKMVLSKNSKKVGYIAIGHWDLGSVAERVNNKYGLTKKNKLTSSNFKRGMLIKLETKEKLGNTYRITKSKKDSNAIAATYCLS